jgi:hypothetical protein
MKCYHSFCVVMYLRGHAWMSAKGVRHRVEPPSSYREQVTSEAPQRVLILGAGRVAGPTVEYLGRDPRRQVSMVVAFGAVILIPDIAVA